MTKIVLLITSALFTLLCYANEVTVKRIKVETNNVLLNDAQVIIVYSLGKTPQLSSNINTIQSNVIRTIVKNTGINTLSNLLVTLDISGANTFTTTKTITTLNPGDSTLISFNSFVPLFLGINSISVYTPADDDNSNNVANWQQEVTYNTFYYADTSTVAGNFGFGSGSGLILVSYYMTNVVRIRKVIVHISDDPANIGNTVYAVALRSDGNLIAQSTPLMLTVSDLDTDKAFLLTTLPLVTQAPFFVGLAQTISATSYNPVSYQNEMPSGNTRFYTSSISAPALDLYPYMENKRFMIQAEMNVGLVPIKLQSFTANKTGNVHKLNWCTSEEVNSKSFVIERSRDGRSFLYIGEVNARGFSNINSNYQYIDKTPLSGINYYRLKMVDIDNEFEFSEIKTVKNIATTAISIYPNPVTDIINLKFDSPQSSKVFCIITDLKGRKLYSQPISLTAGANFTKIPTNNLSGGIYFLKFTLEREVVVKKFKKL